MADNGADIFLILLRPTKVPVAGESVSHLFQGQILVESLEWSLHNEDEQLQQGVRDDDFYEKEDLVGGENNLEQMLKHMNTDVAKAQSALKRAKAKASDSEKEALQDKHDQLMAKSMAKFQEKLKGEYEKRQQGIDGKKSFEEKLADKRADSEGRNRNFEFTFTKRVDIATTQLLNSMKSGDIFPSATLTIHKRSATMMDGTSLVFNIQRIRLLDYQLEVAVTDTMTEMMERWTCEFGSLAYVYKNPPSHYKHLNAAQAAAKTVSQGTVRSFTMKTLGSPLWN